MITAVQDDLESGAPAPPHGRAIDRVLFTDRGG